MTQRRLVVISGGSQGLGAALAAEYIKLGDNVLIVARTEATLKSKVQELQMLINPEPFNEENPESAISSQSIEAKTDGDLRYRKGSESHNDQGGLQWVHYIAADVSQPEACRQVFESLSVTPDIVICCAGSARPGLFIDLTAEDLQKNLKTVYDTALYFSHAALKRLAAASDKLERRRSIVYCSSTAAIFPFIGYGAYAPAKAAIRALADIVRQEGMAHNVTVSHILPGSMDTEGYQVEELTKPSITKEIEGGSPPISAEDAAKMIVRSLEAGQETVYTDTISWVLGSMMLGITPRCGYGFAQTIVGLLLVLFGPVVRFFINRTIRTHKPTV